MARLAISTTNGIEEVPYFIRFSTSLVEAARDRGITLYRASSHKLVEQVLDLVQAVDPENDEVDDQDNDMDTRSVDNSPVDNNGPRSRASTRLVEKSFPAAGDVRMQRSQKKSGRLSDPASTTDNSSRPPQDFEPGHLTVAQLLEEGNRCDGRKIKG
jgi:hypothetical protein